MKRPRIFRSIAFKFWLVLASALLLALAVAFGATYFSTQKRFISYSFSLLKEQLESLESEIVEVHEHDPGLSLYRTLPGAWRMSLHRTLKFTRGIGFPNPQDSPKNMPPNRWREQQQFRGRQLYEAQRRFYFSLALHDADKSTIASGKFQPKEIYWHPVKKDGKLIAYISFEKPNYVVKKKEAVFLEQILLFFIKIAMVMIVASAIVAAILSKWLIAPVSRISQSARKVTQGNLTTRVEYSADDELGELCNNFNDMCKKLESNEIARKQWLADISHEMRTPVAVLKAQIEAMLDGIRKPTNDNISLLKQKTTSLEQLINDLYELSLSDTGDLKLNCETIAFSAFTHEFLEDQHHRAEKQNISVEFADTSGRHTNIHGDPYKLLQILNNLFNNSLRYTDSPGKIRWSITSTADHILLVAEDSAPSVSPHEIEKIFDRLYRVEQSRNRATGGAGLGLPLSKNIAEAHGGKLTAEQSELGGLKIILHLPRGI